MGVDKVDDLRAFQAAREFKLAVYKVIRNSSTAVADERYRYQVFDSAASVEINIAEGFRRFSAGEFCQFSRYSRASLEETERWLQDGVSRGYFDDASLAETRRLADTSARRTIALWRSLQPFIRKGR